MERPVQFTNGSETLRGILHEPDASHSGRGLGVVFLHGWTGCRLGPHRMFVDMARRLSNDGFTALRFDFQGRGESEGLVSDASIRSMVADAVKAADYLRAEAALDTVCFLGICSGAKVAVAASVQGTPPAGLMLWSCEPLGDIRRGTMQLRKSGSMLRVYLRKALKVETWRKLMLGRVNMVKVREAVLTSERPDADEMAWESVCLNQFKRFKGRVLFVHGTRDTEAAVADAAYREFCAAHGIPSRHHAVEGANHSFYSLDWASEVFRVTCDWLTDECA